VTFCSARRVLLFDVVRLSAPVPWLSGRASASHAEGRWFDPSRDHKYSRSSDMVFESQIRLRAKYVPNGFRVTAWKLALAGHIRAHRVDAVPQTTKNLVKAQD
jgi:hypothetical protein